MEVKTGTLRNNLSRYLQRVRRTGDTIVVMDRNTPVAEIRPYTNTESKLPTEVWARRERFQCEGGALEEDFELPGRITDARKQKNPLD